MEKNKFWSTPMWTGRKFSARMPQIIHPFPSTSMAAVASSNYDSWEEQAFAEDSAGGMGSCVWPPRSYSCSFCAREFKSAQALGGHMNVHRRDRARLKQSSPSPTSQQDHKNTHHLHLPYHHPYSSQVRQEVGNPNPNPNPNHDHINLIASTTRSLPSSSGVSSMSTNNNHQPEISKEKIISATPNHLSFSPHLRTTTPQTKASTIFGWKLGGEELKLSDHQSCGKRQRGDQETVNDDHKRQRTSSIYIPGVGVGVGGGRLLSFLDPEIDSNEEHVQLRLRRPDDHEDQNPEQELDLELRLGSQPVAAETALVKENCSEVLA